MPRKMKSGGLLFTLVLAAGLLSWACAATGPARQTELLLQREYLLMEQAALPTYYRQLSDQLVRETRALRAAGALARPRDRQRLDDLRRRWNEVRERLAAEP